MGKKICTMLHNIHNFSGDPSSHLRLNENKDAHNITNNNYLTIFEKVLGFTPGRVKSLIT